MVETIGLVVDRGVVDDGRKVDITVDDDVDCGIVVTDKLV